MTDAGTVHFGTSLEVSAPLEAFLADLGYDQLARAPRLPRHLSTFSADAIPPDRQMFEGYPRDRNSDRYTCLPNPCQ